MAGKLDGKRVAFLFTEGVEQVELTEPLKAVRDADADTELVSLDHPRGAENGKADRRDLRAAGHGGGSRARSAQRSLLELRAQLAD